MKFQSYCYSVFKTFMFQIFCTQNFFEKLSKLIISKRSEKYQNLICLKYDFTIYKPKSFYLGSVKKRKYWLHCNFISPYLSLQISSQSTLILDMSFLFIDICSQQSQYSHYNLCSKYCHASPDCFRSTLLTFNQEYPSLLSVRSPYTASEHTLY